MLRVIKTYINRDKGVEESGADTDFRAGERRGSMVNVQA